MILNLKKGFVFLFLFLKSIKILFNRSWRDVSPFTSNALSRQLALSPYIFKQNSVQYAFIISKIM